ncbi:hypothetical protein CEXT_374062 [Caerostris extrusa]|uniref:ATP synthase F0 subunit 8 n=1 Tax=Caerostris extrusa TaxID=172846 RepID=A0AAV4YA41_CAEEX|nr:hypothetical protein CEXT_374062 [Caerostris extrusa]
MSHTMLDPRPKSWIFVHADLNSVIDISRMKFLEWKWILLFLLMIALFQAVEVRRIHRRQRLRSDSNGTTTPGDLLLAPRPSMKPNMKQPTFNQNQKMQKFNKKYAFYASGKPMTKKSYKQAKKKHSATKKFLLTEGTRRGRCRSSRRRQRHRSDSNGTTTPGDLSSALSPSMKPNMKQSTFNQDQKMQKFNKKYAFYASGKPMTKKPYKQAKKKHSATKNFSLRTNNSKFDY